MSMRPIDEQLAAEEAAERRERPLRCGFRALFQAIAAAEAEAHGMAAALERRAD